MTTRDSMCISLAHKVEPTKQFDHRPQQRHLVLRRGACMCSHIISSIARMWWLHTRSNSVGG